MTIVRSTYRYKRPPRKRKTVALDVPAIVKPTPTKRHGPVIRLGTKGAEAVNDNGDQPRAAAIVTAKNPRRSRLGFSEVPDMTPEEHKRRGDAADALFREMKRQIAEELRK